MNYIRMFKIAGSFPILQNDSTYVHLGHDPLIVETTDSTFDPNKAFDHMVLVENAEKEREKYAAKHDTNYVKSNTTPYRSLVYNYESADPTTYGDLSLQEYTFWDNQITAIRNKCAKYVMDAYTAEGIDIKLAGIYGDAWTIPQNIVSKGGSMVFNIYDDPRWKTATSNSLIKNLSKELLPNAEKMYSKLLVGDVVGMFNPGSTYHLTAREGTTYNTHIGFISKIENGIPYVSHNIGGRVLEEPINKIFGGADKVTVAVRPGVTKIMPLKYDSQDVSRFSVTPEGEKVIGTRESNPEYYAYMDGIALVQDYISSIYELSPEELDELSLAALTIPGRETLFMTNTLSDMRGFNGAALTVTGKIKNAAGAWMRELYHDGKRLLAGVNPNTTINDYEKTVSSDLIKMKYNTIASIPGAALALGILSPKDLNDPLKGAAATQTLIAHNYNSLKKLRDANPALLEVNGGLTDSDLVYLATTSYNTGLKNIENYLFKDGKVNTEAITDIKNKNTDWMLFDQSYGNRSASGIFGAGNTKKRSYGGSALNYRTFFKRNDGARYSNSTSPDDVKTDQNLGTDNGAQTSLNRQLTQQKNLTLRHSKEGRETILNFLNNEIIKGEKLKVDGKIGAKTLEAIKQFQRMMGIKDDGIWGSQSESAYKLYLLKQQQRELLKLELQKNTSLINTKISLLEVPKITLPTLTMPNIPKHLMGGKINYLNLFK